MIFVTLLIYIKNGQEAVFHQFEALAIPIIAKYNGRLLLRTRPSSDTIIEQNPPSPYEIHLIEFATETDFQNFLLDKERQAFLHLRGKNLIRNLKSFFIELICQYFP